MQTRVPGLREGAADVHRAQMLNVRMPLHPSTKLCSITDLPSHSPFLSHVEPILTFQAPPPRMLRALSAGAGEFIASHGY